MLLFGPMCFRYIEVLGNILAAVELLGLHIFGLFFILTEGKST